MTLFQSLILGLVEGITEFLPISSTAHLIIVQKLFGIQEVSEFFTTIVQLGAIAGLMWVERGRLYRMCIDGARSRKTFGSTLIFKVLLASTPVLVAGFFIKDHISALHNTIPLIALMSIVVGLLLLFAEVVARKSIKVSDRDIPTRTLFIMGVFQVLSLLPGTSRSGITAAGGALQRLSLAQSLEYSFLLSIPALLAASGYEVVRLTTHPIDPSLILPTLLASGVAFVCAILAVNWLRQVVRTQGFVPFVIYRMIFGIGILGGYFMP